MSEAMMSRPPSLKQPSTSRRPKDGKRREKETLMSPPVSDDQTPPIRGSPITVSKENILMIARNYKGYSIPNITPETTISTGIYNMENVIEYDVDDSIQERIWEAEIERLSNAVTDLDKPLIFTGMASVNHTTKEGFEYLARLADIVLVCLNISIHDSQAILEKHCPDLMMESLYNSSRSLLMQYTGDEDEDENGDKNEDGGNASVEKGENSEWEIAYPDCFGLIDYLTAILARPLCKSASGSDWHNEILAYLGILATKLKITSHKPKESAAISLRTHPPAQQRPIPLSGVPRAHTRGSADIGRNLATGGLDVEGGKGTKTSNGTLDKLVDYMNSLGRTDHIESSPRTRRYIIQQHYWIDSTKIRTPLQLILRHILTSMRGQNKLSSSLATSFEMCATLSDMGLDDLPLLVFQSITGECLGTWKSENLNVGHAAFEVLNIAMESIRTPIQGEVFALTGGNQSTEATRKESPSLPSLSQSKIGPSVAEGVKMAATAGSTTDPSSTKVTLKDSSRNVAPRAAMPNINTSITWHYKVLDSSDSPTSDKSSNQRKDMGIKPQRRFLQSMSEVVTIMLPLLLTSPKVVSMTTGMIGLCTHATDTYGKILLYQTTKVKASFCLSTDEYDLGWTRKKLESVSPLSKSLLARDALLTWHSEGGTPERALTVSSNAQDTLPITGTQEIKEGKTKIDQAQQGLEALQSATRIMNEWVFEEGGVRVKCGWYVGTCMGIATMLVVGGITAGLTISNRLLGVDPFNITTFCWVLAAFFIVIVKSIRVAQWPWRDFLRRQVLCRSVTELKSVTGIDGQLIIARLLLDEAKTQLQTRGPYNCVFNRRTESTDAFSIDEPLGIRTMLLSGLIMVQVHAPYHGEFLVCLDSRRGTEYEVVMQSKSPVEEEEYIVSDKLIDRKASEHSPTRIHLKRTKEAMWSGIVGVYKQENSYFT
ncbi:hypothetical protein F5X99DRAFT_377307 [Biscogniauxia marginata]|nr:hypothetical protein F5X99DRAFT_377307 [Biscogniauxia marginata]